MIGSFISRVLILALGHVYPAYKCYKTVELNKPEIEQLRFWCQYWILVAFLSVLGAFADVFFSWWASFHSTMKQNWESTCFCGIPKQTYESKLFQGATIVYEKYVGPYIAEHEHEIDLTLLEFRARASDSALIAQQLLASFLKASLSGMVKYALLMMPAQKLDAFQFQQLQQPGQPQEPLTPSVMLPAHQPAASQPPQSEARALFDPMENSEPQEQPIKEGISLHPSPAQSQERVPETQVEDQETLTAEEMNGAGGGESKDSWLLMHKIDPLTVMRVRVNFVVAESVTPPPEIMEVPLAPPPEQHDTDRFPELPDPEEFENIMRTSSHCHRELKKLRRTQEEALWRRLAAEGQGDTTSTIDCVAEVVLLCRIREMQRDLENRMREIGWILQGIMLVEAEIEASTYEAAVALCRTLVEQKHLIDLAVEQEAEGEGAAAAGEGPMACLRCGKAAATVAVMPCNHLCLCVDCGGDGSVQVCPECNGVSAGTVRVGL
ncbi:hypothetical protein ZIOFF_046220 [Zingiber officinale]|uniref:HVA22-like protein n=1 Tax=Zingiber officinale TaxID=94328 RepID=A0A8J5KSC9_ZINOF|nr:hypothetical protein ZIOFF_046220 [Zingiber officinale]